MAPGDAEPRPKPAKREPDCAERPGDSRIVVRCGAVMAVTHDNARAQIPSPSPTPVTEPASPSPTPVTQPTLLRRRLRQLTVPDARSFTFTTRYFTRQPRQKSRHRQARAPPGAARSNKSVDGDVRSRTP